jgi:hypothetical protein
LHNKKGAYASAGSQIAAAQSALSKGFAELQQNGYNIS